MIIKKTQASQKKRCLNIKIGREMGKTGIDKKVKMS